MACRSSAGSAFTVATSVARLTLASRTPGTDASAFSTRPAQEAQVMPTTGRLQSIEGPAAGGVRVAVALVEFMVAV